MLRTTAVGLLITTILATRPMVSAEPTLAAPPQTYEVQINGESFLVDANRAVKLESKEKPGVSYSVAVRVAPVQRMRLGAIQFDYELPAKVETDGKHENRTARLIQELGFSILLTDLGQPLDPATQKTTLEVLVGSVTKALEEAKAEGIDVSSPHERTFANSSARGVTVRYQDSKHIGHVYLVYVLTGPTFAVSCVAEYLDHDSDDVLPLIKKTLDSVRANPERR
jgi:hypothetical protein